MNGTIHPSRAGHTWFRCFDTAVPAAAPNLDKGGQA